MKIIENNNYIGVVCSHCKSKLGVHVEDIHYNEISHNCSEFEVTCGACGRTTEVKHDLIPNSWIQKIVPDDSGH